MEKIPQNNNLSKVALKNSSYSLLSVFILKFGGLIFTILIARILLPELFGIYSLALSVVSVLMVFTDFGIHSAFMKYGSESLGKKNYKKYRAYLRYSTKLKFFATSAVIIGLIIAAKFVSYNLYEKPLLFYPLIFATLFIFMESFKEFIGAIFCSIKYLSPLPPLNFIHQLSKIAFSLLAISVVAFSFKISSLFVAFALSAIVYLFLSIIILIKGDKKLFFGEKSEINKKQFHSYLGFMGITLLSLAFFGSIDTLMLGKFVSSEYIGYYRVALSFVLTIASIFSLSGVMLPIFTQIHKNRFKRGFQKTFRYLMFIAIPATIGMIFVGKNLIFAIYGKEYLLAASSLYFLSLLIITSPLINLYNIILQSRDKAKILAKGVFISLVINIVLNYFLIKYLIGFGQEHAIIGVGIATVISRMTLLLILSINARQKFNLKIRGIGLRSIVFASFIMALFLVMFNKIIDMNLFYGAIEIILGIIIYFVALIIFKGATKEDWKLIKSLIKK